MKSEIPFMVRTVRSPHADIFSSLVIDRSVKWRILKWVQVENAPARGEK